jgi:uncharacterized protein (TIGR03790 family)
MLVGPFFSALAGQGEEVVVIYNSRMPESKSLAEYYAAKRAVPANQVIGLSLPTGDNMTRAEFRDDLQRPLARALESRKLWEMGDVQTPATNGAAALTERKVVRSSIRYAALCYGVPLRILKDPNLKEVGAEKLRPEMQRNEAAVDSELAFLPLIEEKLPLFGPLKNPLFGATNAALIHPTNGVLMVTRLDGPSPEIARGLVDKALLAEADGLWGRTYFDLRGTTDPSLKQGDDWIRNASAICHQLGFETVVDENAGTFPESFPMSQIAIYIGWYTENVNGPFVRTNVEFMPGAFAYHLHSFSAANLRSPKLNWTGPLLAKGATITMGCVDEPYLGGTPDVGVFTGRLMYYGFSFGEAACASQAVLSWQATVVGDPLYRPFGRNADVVHKQLEARKSKLLEWSWLRLVDLHLANGRSKSDSVLFLQSLEITRESAVLTEKLGDLLDEMKKHALSIASYRRALTLDPSPQQRVRLMLTLADKLGAHDQHSEAFETYQKLLSDCPDYPDKTDIYRRLEVLADKLGQKADVEKYRKLIEAK